jgi:hypothetical protein
MSAIQPQIAAMTRMDVILPTAPKPFFIRLTWSACRLRDQGQPMVMRCVGSGAFIMVRAYLTNPLQYRSNPLIGLSLASKRPKSQDRQTAGVALREVRLFLPRLESA